MMLDMLELEQLQQEQTEVALLYAQTQAQGGDRWYIERVSGNGVTAPVVSSVLGQITGYVYLHRRQLGTTESGTPRIHVEWRLRCTSDQPVQVGDRLSAVSDPSFSFLVVDRVRKAGYLQARLEAQG